eukprot:scaffold1261_cov377-Prasinococcus_capsulatus_cf.AAC.14
MPNQHLRVGAKSRSSAPAAAAADKVVGPRPGQPARRYAAQGRTCFTQLLRLRRWMIALC